MAFINNNIIISVLLTYLLIIVNLMDIVESTSSSNTRVVAGITIDEEMQRVLLDQHNSLRNTLALNGISSSNQPTATYMNKLHWDPAIAANAQKYTDLCNYGHNKYRNTTFLEIDGTLKEYSTFAYEDDTFKKSYALGENVALMGPVTEETMYSIAYQSALAWWNEHFNYTYSSDNPSCSDVCGHYTAMAWADTRYIGCGASICPYGNTGIDVLITMCEYYPAGNVNNNPPYTSGTPCTECDINASDRDECDGISSGLCTGCMAFNWTICDDKYWNCPYLTCPTTTTCQEDPSQWICPYCKKSCNTCPTSYLTPSPTCIDSFDGLSYTGSSAFSIEGGDNHHDEKSIDHVVLIVVIICLIVIGFIGTIIGCFVYYHRRKKNKGHVSFEFDENKDKQHKVEPEQEEEPKKEEQQQEQEQKQKQDLETKQSTDNTIPMETSIDKQEEEIEIDVDIITNEDTQEIVYVNKN